MNILLLRDKKKPGDISALLASLLRDELKSAALDVLTVAPGRGWAASDLHDHLYKATRVLIVETFRASWVYFTMGFCQGQGIPVMYYGRERPAAELFRHVPHASTPDEFKEFLRTNFKDILREDTRREGRRQLLKKGVPFTMKVLGRCIAERDYANTALFIKAGFSPDTRDHDGIPLLCLAARAGDAAMVKMLIDAGADVNQHSLDRDCSALIDAAFEGYKEAAAVLVSAGADVNITDKDGQSALIIVVGHGDAESVELLLKAGADPDAIDHLGVSARKYAALFKNPAVSAIFDRYPPK